VISGVLQICTTIRNQPLIKRGSLQKIINIPNQLESPGASGGTQLGFTQVIGQQACTEGKLQVVAWPSQV